jgi:hypothetical protein
LPHPLCASLRHPPRPSRRLRPYGGEGRGRGRGRGRVEMGRGGLERDERWRTCSVTYTPNGGGCTSTGVGRHSRPQGGDAEDAQAARLVSQQSTHAHSLTPSYARHVSVSLRDAQHLSVSLRGVLRLPSPHLAYSPYSPHSRGLGSIFDLDAWRP